MNKNRIIFYILAILFIVIAFLTYGKLKVNINVKVNNPEVNELLNVNIELKKFNKYANADEISIELFNKYKKDETISSEVKPYEVGKYKFSYLPQYSGKYVVNINIKIKGKTYVKSKEIEI